MIAKKADVAKGTLYWHFPGKKELFYGIMETGIEDYYNFMKEIKNNEELNCREKLEKIIEHRPVFLKKHSSIIREVMVSNRAEVDEQFKKKIGQLKQKNIDLLTEIFKEGMDRDEFNIEDPYLTALIFMGINVFIGNKHKLSEQGNKERTLRIIKNIIFNGISS